jgi:hypothetical protein
MLETKQYISLKSVENNLFETVNPIKKGTGFKIELKNNTECYVYIVGKETDGSSYVLFPYPSKADPKKQCFLLIAVLQDIVYFLEEKN